MTLPTAAVPEATPDLVTSRAGTAESATVAGAVVTITSPAAIGSSVNGVIPTSAQTLTLTKTAFAGGITAGDVDMTATSFSQGLNWAQASVATRQDVGDFNRVDIVPWQNPPTNTIPKTFPKYPDRDDCIASPGVCSYAEEMTNFANWYSYYRSRMQMAKSSIGRA